MKKKPPEPQPKPASIPAWTCPKCGATHPITVQSCCAPPKYENPHPAPLMPWAPIGPIYCRIGESQ